MSGKLSESKKEELLRSRQEISGRVPLKDVVADCERRWFEAALKAAKGGDVTMQSLVGQMFCSGYGVASDMKKGSLWLRKSADADDDAYKSLVNLSVGVDAAGLDLGMESQPHPTDTEGHPCVSTKARLQERVKPVED